ncbi:MAG: phosphoenolpyruvate--protein phosphotransferase [Alkaliphilus sp.]|nr:phosphoenolpyruvate--protein phosphotransferase [Alkaliphilus sp. AH-315-G20]MBN4067609.1 phosphoenolpyruvate--protein phosphotransferase [Alkaliphilus transvaalensis]PHS35979.1 MAG: phosphoenolpyruvate--protein phosphotransferase [Alkaliphilus sp.]
MKKGIAASPGIAIGKVLLLEEQIIKITLTKIDNNQIQEELVKFEQAVQKTKKELLQISEQVCKKMGMEKAEIFIAHSMMAEDLLLKEKVEKKISDEFLSADNAVNQAIQEITKLFSAMKDEYMSERAIDFKDVGIRLLNNILKIPAQDLNEITDEVILVSKDLTPSATAQINKQKVLGFATDMGGKTSHTAIMARTLEIPAVTGLIDLSREIKNDDTIIVDGINGLVIINPDKKTLQDYKSDRNKYLNEVSQLKELKNLPAETKDGFRIELAANIGTPQDVVGALGNGAEGIGLYRTEFLYMDRDSMPNEDEQFEAYKQVVEKMDGKPTIIRTLDIGGDKKLSYLKLDEEMNPFLGVRAIRLCLRQPEIFKIQLRAILRASTFGRLKIMYPMIATVEEVKAANQILKEIKSQLANANVAFDSEIQTGIMVEIPATAINADLFANEVDFFSIGTNDLIQYTMAADRMNENLSELYDLYNPAILRLIKNVIVESKKAGKWTGMCGEMAGDPMSALILLGLGIDELSMSAIAIPRVKKVIRSVTKKEASEIANKVFEMKSSKEIRSYLNKTLEKVL